MPLVSHLPPLLLSPLLYAALVGFWLGMYVVWALARRAYLGTIPTMNTYALAWFGFWIGGVMVSSLRHYLSHQLFGTAWLVPHPQAAQLLAGMVGLAIAASVYIRKIRYPFWRVSDMVCLGLFAAETAIALGWLIENRSLTNLAVVAGLPIATCIASLLYAKMHRTGVIAGLQLVVVFGLAAALRHLTPSWQHAVTGVEWLADWIGIIWGIAVIILRLSQKSRRLVLTDIPRGVSQGFRETFTKVIASRKPSSMDGSTRT